MSRRSSMTSWAGRSLPIAMVLVALALSLCLFQVASTGTHHAGMSPDVCSGFFLVSFLVILPYFAKAGGAVVPAAGPRPRPGGGSTTTRKTEQNGGGEPVTSRGLGSGIIVDPR